MRERATVTDALRITNQFRSNGSMMYDLRGAGSRLTLVVTQRTSPADPDEWRVEARALGQPEVTPIEQWGHTRIDALRAVARAWMAKPSSGVPQFDWEAVVTALLAVRAI